MANFLSQGEVCSNGTRIYVEEGIYAAFLSQLVSQVKAMRVGDPLHEDTTVGATIRHGHKGRYALAFWSLD
jgi:acyl-CoA reductase-like NAD-dependent aldehyde dehydrogenase